MSSASPTSQEWLEADGLGGFASGTASGIRTRRYHALLLAATTPPTGRFVVVNGIEAWLETPLGSFALSSQHYAPDVIYPDGAAHIERFTADPWPRWTFALPDGTRIEHGILAQTGRASTALYWRLLEGRGGTLAVRPLISGRDYHSLHHENARFNFDADVGFGRVVFQPYHGVPSILVHTDAIYSHQPVWYRNFLYVEERDRGLDCVEDLASPGVFRWNLTKGEAAMQLTAGGHDATAASVPEMRAVACRRRRSFPSRLHRAADSYIVNRGDGKTIIAGYPWFADWGRDTFIAIRGLCIATGRIDEARSILLEWAGAVSEGMLPNRFSDAGDAPEYNSVDASLWYIVAVYDFIRAARDLSLRDRHKLEAAVDAILTGYAAGTRYGIRADSDGLLASGVPGVQLTWMDAKVGDWVVTPRIGKPVEVQALWLNALRIGGAINERWMSLQSKARESFEARFWNEAGSGLYDVVDCDHRAGMNDAACRPNQIFAVGGLPFFLLDGPRARRIVETVESRLLTPIGLRSLAPGENGYAPRYQGGVRERDGAYHQGTVWPWLTGPFVDAWIRVRGATSEAKHEARERFLAPLLAHLEDDGLGHLPEIADAEAPHAARGCPFQAWSVGEALRLQTLLA